MADPQAPWTSGTEILQNPGNAGLASGSGSGVLPIQVDTKPIYSVLDRLGDEEVKMRFQKHLEARADADALSKTIAEINRQGGSLFNMKGADGSNISYNMLPDDHKVAAGMADDLRRMVVADSDNHEQNPIYQRKLYEYNYAVQHAQKRAVTYANNRLAAQQALDPEDRAGYLNANKTQIEDHPLTDLHNPESYIPKQTVDRSTYFDSKLASDKDNFETTTTIGKNPNDPNDPQGYEISKSRLKNAILDVRANVAPGTKAYTEGVKDYITTVNLLKNDPAEAARIEQEILRINKERGLNIQPYVTVKDGQVLFPTKNGKPDIANFVGAIVAEHYSSESQNMKPTNLDEQRRKIASDEEKEKEKTALDRQKLWEEIRHHKAEEAKGAKPTAEQTKQEIDKVAGEAAYREVKQAYNPGKYTDKNELSPLKSTEAAVITGFPIGKYSFYNVPQDVRAEHYIGLEDKISTTTESDKSRAGGAENKTSETSKDVAGRSVTADRIIAVKDNDTKKVQFVYEKDGKLIAIVPERDAIMNKVKHDSKYTPSIYTDRATHGQYAYDQNAPVEAGSPSSTGNPERPTSVPDGAKYKKTKAGSGWILNGRTWTADGVELK